MPSNALPHSTRITDRALTALTALTALAAGAATLIVAFVAAPRVLASAWSGRSFGNQDELVAVVREAFVDYWASGESGLSPQLHAVTDYWARYHVVKAVIAALTLATVVAFGILLAKKPAVSGDLGPGRRTVRAGAGVLAAILAVVSVAALMANIQGAVAPFSSLLSLLPIGERGGDLPDIVGQIGQQFADGQWTPPLAAMIDDFARYHAAMGVIAGCAAAILLASSALSWTRFVRAGESDRQARRTPDLVGVFSTVMSLALIVVAAANAGTAADPAPALAAFFDGGVL
ncbi:hypothetical protein [Rhodococcus sp. ACT016]|uniref:hypothetical protein n=1 Tax=Rhodococcus sp. ACT016 TaxID=3134808 RepID=UPI003D26BEB5